MTTFHFSLSDLSRTRFAISPLWECVTGLRALRDPARAAVHLPWIREALPAARSLELGTALALTPTEGYIPDFLTPPPTSPLAVFEDEIETLRATPGEQMVADIRTLGLDAPGEAEKAAFVAHPREEVNRLCDVLAEFWRLTLEPHWPRMRSVLEDDVRYRSRQLADGGPALLFDDLHPAMTWVDDRIEVHPEHCPMDGDLGGRGLLLVPSVLQVTRPTSIVDEPWQPTVFYPARGISLMWESEAAGGSDALGRLVGETRARLLASLSAPRSTTDLASSLSLSAGGVSEHLSVLRESGLVRGERSGRSVLYLRTELADQLLGV